MAYAVLNPALYDFLIKSYGRVKVAKRGQVMRYKVADSEGGKFVAVLDGGEEYAVCCPMCGDRRFRFSVNHTYGTMVEGQMLTHLAHCWNEQCERRGLREDLFRRWEDYTAYGISSRTAASVAAEKQLQPLTVSNVVDECSSRFMRLGRVELLASLPASHPAREYVDRRGFDSTTYGKAYSLGVSFDQTYQARWALNRLIVPIWMLGKQVGWQARVIEGFTPLTPDENRGKSWPYKEPKYWTSPGMRKSFLLYNYDVAQRYRNLVVILEGVTDVWRVGGCAAGLFGKSMSSYQTQLIAETWGFGAWIILFGDADAKDAWEANAAALRRHVQDPSKVVVVFPSSGKDAGGMTQEAVWKEISDICPTARS